MRDKVSPSARARGLWIARVFSGRVIKKKKIYNNKKPHSSEGKVSEA
jgi:hypothetical protein